MPKKHRYKVVRKVKGQKGKTIYGAFPSKPGEPPHKQTGRLRASITHELVDLGVRIGTSIPYGRMLEFGTSKMKPRPWALRALNESRAEIQKILTDPILSGPLK